MRFTIYLGVLFIFFSLLTRAQETVQHKADFISISGSLPIKNNGKSNGAIIHVNYLKNYSKRNFIGLELGYQMNKYSHMPFDKSFSLGLTNRFNFSTKHSTPFWGFDISVPIIIQKVSRIENKTNQIDPGINFNLKIGYTHKFNDGNFAFQTSYNLSLAYIPEYTEDYNMDNFPYTDICRVYRTNFFSYLKIGFNYYL